MNTNERIKIRFFVSYAHKDEEYSSTFIDEFKEMSAPSKKYEYKLWQDNEILPGEKWEAEISQALNECDMGLLLISPAFLGSKYVGEKELSKFTGENGKIAIPVMLKMVNFKHHDLKGLNKNQIFRLKVDGVKEPKSFAQCSKNQKTDYVFELFDRVEKRLDKIISYP